MPHWVFSSWPSYISPLKYELFGRRDIDRKSTRLNSSHQIISYAVFCLKKKNTSFEDMLKQTDEAKVLESVWSPPNRNSALANSSVSSAGDRRLRTLLYPDTTASFTTI